MFLSIGAKAAHHFHVRPIHLSNPLWPAASGSQSCKKRAQSALFYRLAARETRFSARTIARGTALHVRIAFQIRHLIIAGLIEFAHHVLKRHVFICDRLTPVKTVGNFARRSAPVSYTHLDVYKRQPLTAAIAAALHCKRQLVRTAKRRNKQRD